MKKTEKIKENNTDILKIDIKDKKNLTKNQKLFNQLTQQIEELESEIIEENKKLSKILEFYSKEIKPLLDKNNEIKFDLAVVLGNSTDRIKYTKKQLSEIKEVITDLCNCAFSSLEPNEEQEAFYDKWSDTTYKEELDIQEKEMKEMFSDMINQMFGEDIDMNNIDPKNPESFIKINEILKSKFEDLEQKEKELKNNKKKTKKQIQKEEQLKIEEEIKNKSVRSIYINLVKILHPDSEIDPKIKLEKEEIMKKVTLAYEEKDFSTLLKLELEWVHMENKHLEKLTDDKLKIYINVLQEQVVELINEKQNIYMNPRFESILKFVHYTEKSAFSKMRKEIKTLKATQEDFMTFIEEFKNTKSKKPIINFINEYIQILLMTNSMTQIFNFL
jgi:hypothetical protein